MDNVEILSRIKREREYREEFSPYECPEAYDAYFDSLHYEQRLLMGLSPKQVNGTSFVKKNNSGT